MKSIVLLVALSLISTSSIAGVNLRHSSEFGPSDYLNRDNTRRDTTFDNLRVADLGINLGVGSDCGRIRLDASLKASLKNLFDTKYFADMGKDILDGSWMLVLCYLSPNWCSILRHFRLNSQFIAGMRQNQCGEINKFIDSRVAEFNQSRQECVSRILEEGGNAERMAEECGNRSLYEFNLKSWVSDSSPTPSENRLLEDSAKWARYQGGEKSKIVQLAKQFVGETVISRGSVRLEYGPDKVYIPPQKYLNRLVRQKRKRLCTEILKAVDSAKGNFERAVSQADINELNGSSEVEYVDRQTIRYLSLLPKRKRGHYCNKIAWALGNIQMNRVSGEVQNFLNLASQNPRLPDARKKEILRKKQMFMEDMSNIQREQEHTNTPLNVISAEINREGRSYQDRIVTRESQVSGSSNNSRRLHSQFFDCSTPAMCHRAGRTRLCLVIPLTRHSSFMWDLASTNNSSRSLRLMPSLEDSLH